MMDKKREQELEEATDMLAEGIQKLFESDDYLNYLTFLSSFHHYSFRNALLIYMQNPNASLCAGYNDWQKRGRQVKKGEKGIRIFAPCRYKVTETNDEGEESERWMIRGFRLVSTFDISQTEGDDLPEICYDLSGEVDHFNAIIDAIEDIAKYPLVFCDIPGDTKGYCSWEQEVIAIQSEMSDAQTLKTAIHELAHSIMHDPAVIDREAIQAANPDYKRTFEVQAESVAYVVSKHFGLDTSDYSFGYIAGWAKGKELEELNESLNIICHTADVIITKIEAAIAA